MHGKNTGECEGKTVCILCPSKALGWAILHDKSQQAQWQERETATVSVGHYTSSSARYSQN